MSITEELKAFLLEKGADLAGVGSMDGVPGCDYKYGVAIAIRVPSHIVRDLQTAPTKEYLDAYHALNAKLDEIVAAGEEFLQNKGFEAYARYKARVKVNSDNISDLPHKTVAARAGLGWVGKNNLMVTPQYGSAVRLSSILTNAPLDPADPILESRCGSCSACVDKCPGHALAGTLWKAGMKREEIVDINTCIKAQTEAMLKSTGINTDLCGKCFAVCTYTQKYLNSLEK